MKWSLYIVECADKTLYTGVTTDVEKRINTHNLGNGAKSIRGKLPVKLVHVEKFNDHSGALKREAVIKKLNRIEKLKLIGN